MITAATSVSFDRPNNTVYDWTGRIPDYSRPQPWLLMIPEEFVKMPGMYIGVQIYGEHTVLW